MRGEAVSEIRIWSQTCDSVIFRGDGESLSNRMSDAMKLVSSNRV